MMFKIFYYGIHVLILGLAIAAGIDAAIMPRHAEITCERRVVGPWERFDLEES